MAKPPAHITNSLALPKNAVVPPEKDRLYDYEIAEEYKTLKAQKEAIQNTELNLRNLRAKENEAMGIEPAYVTKDDLSEIISDVLLTNSTISKAFRNREQSSSKCKNWAKRAIKGDFNKGVFDEAIQQLKPEVKGIIDLMKKYKQLNIKAVVSSNTYSKALNEMKKQLAITKTLQQKNDEIASLNVQLKLANNTGIKWEDKALKLKKIGLTNAAIVSQVDRGRVTVSTYLNRPDIKAQWNI